MDNNMRGDSVSAPGTSTSPHAFPLRKRRRPALACEECRHRKIKCDRSTPCGPCSRSRSKTCTYQNLQDDHSAAAPMVRRIPPRVSLDAVEQNRPQDHEHIGSANSYSSHPSAPASTNSSLTGAPHFNGHQQNSIATTEHVQALLNRVQTLEKKLQDATRNGLNGETHESSHTQPRLTPAFPKEYRAKKKSNYEKTRYCGHNHWMNHIKQFDFMIRIKSLFGKEQKEEMHALVHKFKRLTNTTKLQNLIPQSIPLDFRDHVPSREVADVLVKGYIRTFESVFRIVHIPSFQKEYDDFWSDPKAARDLYVIKLLLVMAIGTCFYQETSSPEVSRTSVRSSATQWIHTAEVWLSTPYRKQKSSLANLEIKCLLLVARQTTVIKADHIWVSAGSLLRTAMHMGLHRDPSQLFDMSTLHAEHRRRLWATVVEILLQSSMDSGGPPLISMDDFDCEPPSNVDDSQLDETTRMPVVSKPDTTFTDSSIQVALAKTFPVRIAIAKLVNDFRANDSYDQTLRLAGDLAVACRQQASAIQFWQSTITPDTTPPQPTPFQAKLLTLFTQRFLLSLHLPYATKSKTNPTYYFSRQASLEAAMSLLAPVSQDLQSQDDYAALRLRGAGIFRDLPLHATLAVGLELTTQLSAPQSPFPSYVEGVARAEARSAIERYSESCAARLEAGEQSVKPYAFTRCLLAQIKSMEEGTSLDEEVRKSAKESTNFCLGILERRAGSSAGESVGEVVDESPLGGIGWDTSIPDPNLNFQMPDSWSPFDWVSMDVNSWL